MTSQPTSTINSQTIGAEPMSILVSDDISERGLQPLREAGFQIVKKVGLSPEELKKTIVGFSGLVVRSETTVTADLLSQAPDLRVVGRAGVGVDNIDVNAR